MLIQLITLSCFSFAALYPLCLWMHPGVPITPSFNRFTLGLSLFMCLLGTSMLMLLHEPGVLGMAALWAAGLLVTLCTHWDRDGVREWVVTIPCVVGLILFTRVQNRFLHAAHPELELSGALWMLSLFGGAIAVLVVYNTALGHWYLETKARVPVQFLKRGVNVLWILLALRFAWDILQGFRMTAYVQGEPVSLFQYMTSLEGLVLGIGPVMGTAVPFVLMWFVHETLKIRSTTSATGMLYGATLCVMMGDLAYRYVLLSAGMAL